MLVGFVVKDYHMMIGFPVITKEQCFIFLY